MGSGHGARREAKGEGKVFLVLAGATSPYTRAYENILKVPVCSYTDFQCVHSFRIPCLLDRKRCREQTLKKQTHILKKLQFHKGDHGNLIQCRVATF